VAVFYSPLANIFEIKANKREAFYMSKFWRWVKNDLHLNGAISEQSWWGDEVTPALFKSELQSTTGDITVWINSPGGDVFAAAQIYNALKEYPSHVTILKSNWHESQRMMSKYGLIYSTKTRKDDGNDILEATFFIDASIKFYKTAELAWDKIWRVVEQNCTQSFNKNDAQNTIMRQLIGVE